MTVVTDTDLDAAIEEKLAMTFSASTVGPDARKHLAPLLRYYAKKPKPFTACYRDNVKRWGPELTKKRCAVIVDLIKGTTKWRSGGHKASIAASDAELFDNAPEIGDELATCIDKLSDEEFEKIEDLAWEAHMAVEEAESGTFIHLHLSDSTPVQEEEMELADGKKAKVLWKDVLVEGEYPMSPGPDGATDKPMRVIAEGKSDPATKTISMSDIIEAHEDSAFKYVTIPTSHRDGLLDNTGYVVRPKGVRVVEKNGKKVMQSALGFTEPEIKGKVERGTIPDVSAGIFFNWLNKHTKKRYRAAMKHVALTPVPFMGNLDPFPAVFASDEEIPEGTHVEVYDFSDNPDVALDTTPTDGGGASTDTGGNSAEIVWNERDGHNWIRSAVEDALRPAPQPEGLPYTPQPNYYVQDVSADKKTALVEEYFKGDRVRYVIPFTVENDAVKPAPSTRWVEVREAMVAASDKDFEEMSTDKLLEKLSIALSAHLGKTDSVYRVDKITLDNRMKIVNRGLGKEWVAEFALLGDDVWVAPTETWEAITASDKPNDAKQPASSSQKVSIQLHDNVSVADGSTEARLMAARQRRRQIVAHGNK